MNNILKEGSSMGDIYSEKPWLKNYDKKVLHHTEV